MRQEVLVPSKIVSGGQSGVDRAALDVAIWLGVPHGGWCPRGRLAEDGAIPVGYNLTETASGDYPQRTEKNVLDSDGTLIICHGTPSGGTRLTVQLAKRHKKPLLVLDLDDVLDGDVAGWRDALFEWQEANCVATLNVAGPRESQSQGIQREVFDLLLRVFQAK